MLQMHLISARASAQTQAGGAAERSAGAAVSVLTEHRCGMIAGRLQVLREHRSWKHAAPGLGASRDSDSERGEARRAAQGARPCSLGAGKRAHAVTRRSGTDSTLQLHRRHPCRLPCAAHAQGMASISLTGLASTAARNLQITRS